MPLPPGKLPPDLLARLIARLPAGDPRVLLGPGVGLDCAVVDAGERLHVYKSDPITFAADQIGYYLVQVNANDIATTGAKPLWLLVTLLLPEKGTTPELAESIMAQVGDACRALGITVIGGHTEITTGLDRPIAIGTMIGEVSRAALLTPAGIRPGDHILLTKGVPIEATSLLAREFPERLTSLLTAEELREAQDYLFHPGIAVTNDARVAIGAGYVRAMHDPTEGGVVTALWEFARACGKTLRIDPASIGVPPLAQRVCAAFGIDPLCSIASGALLIAVASEGAVATTDALSRAGIACFDIGVVAEGPACVERRAQTGYVAWGEPTADAIAAVFVRSGPDVA
jgi:hydrogenase expression/formation protein HypE